MTASDYYTSVTTNTTGSWPTSNTSIGTGYILPTISFGQASIQTCPDGHITTDEQLECLDGRVISFCELCGERIIVRRVPGGMSALALRELLVKTAAKERDAEDYVRARELRADFLQEQEQLDLAFAQLEVLEQVLRDECDSYSLD